MGVYYDERRGFRFDFRLYKKRHTSPRGFATEDDAAAAETALRQQLMLRAAGVLKVTRVDVSPKFQHWAGIYSTYVHEQHAIGEIKRPDEIDHNLRAILRFFGARPTSTPATKTGPAAQLPRKSHTHAPYHDLHLRDPIDDPSWVRRFDEWMSREGLAASTRGHYLTTVSRMYWLAMQAEYRREAGDLPYNPFRDRPRGKWKRRTVTVSPDQLDAWVKSASYHARLAIAIAALAPKFRLANILALEWNGRHSSVDFERRVITIWQHKTDASGDALVAPMSAQLERILRDARRRHPRQQRVIVYRNRPVKSIAGAVKAAAKASGLKWGRQGGVTFHTIRHAMSTLMAQMKIGPEQRQGVTGRRNLAMEMWYTHLQADDARPTAESLSEALPLELSVTSGPTRARRRAGVTPGVTTKEDR